LNKSIKIEHLECLSKRFQNGLKEKHRLTLKDVYDDQYIHIGEYDSSASLDGCKYLKRYKGDDTREFIIR
jgi:hypothetical protein